MAEAKELTKRRRDLESYMQELHELGEPIAEASVTEGAMPMSSPQLSTSLTAIDQLRSQLMDVHHFIIRTETDSTVRHQDQVEFSERSKQTQRTSLSTKGCSRCFFTSVSG